MSYKNSMKLFASNFTLVWKQALYMFICFMLFILGIYSTGVPIVNLLRQNNIIAELKMIIETAYNTPSAFALELGTVLKHILNVVTSNFGDVWLSLIGFFIFGILIPYLLLQMSFYNITSILYQKLTMNMDVPYIQNGFRLLKHSLIYALASIVINFPFLFIVVFLFEIYIAMAYSTITAIIGLVILFALLILFTSIKISFQTYFMSYMVEKDANSFVSYAKGLINVLKRFWKILSQSVILCLTIIFINGLIALFTFFSGLFITIPATFVLLSIYNLVVYFNMKGDRYYLADNMIFNPIKYQVKQDTFVGTEIPEEIKATELTTVVMKKKRNSKKTKTNKK